jgi:hypothetical protein
MVRRQIDLDEESDRILSRLAADYQGDLGKTVADLLRAHESVESFVEDCEETQRDSLLAQKERAERGFREGRFTAWDEVKRHHDL